LKFKKNNMNAGSKLHYAWVIVLTGMLVLFSCLGLGRFSLGMLLPSMGSSLNLNYSQMGLIGTGNFVGYMISVMIAGFVANRMGPRRTITLGLILVGGSMMLISRAMGFYEVMILYIATGIGSGFANIPLMGLVSHWFLKTSRGRAAGVMISGNGVAIVLTGIFIPWINSSLGAEGWRTGWFVIGIISIAIAGVAAVFLRNDPREKGLRPLGPNNGKPISKTRENKTNAPKENSKWTMVHLGCIYAFFGTTYSVFVTFIVTAMINERGFGEETAGQFWAVVGALSIFSGPLFGWISDKLGRKTGMMIVYGLFTLSYALVAANLPNAFLYAAIGIFGLSVWSIPTIMSATVGDYFGPAKAVKALGFITLFFGAGQITGPAVAGILADITGSFSMAFWLCALLTGSAIVVTYFLRAPAKS
jgi:MFS family permease